MLFRSKLTRFYDDKTVATNLANENIFTKTWRLFSGPKFVKTEIYNVPKQQYDTVNLKTDNGIYIESWYMKKDSASKGTVILFHGLTMNKSNLLSEADEFIFMGYNVLLVDFRAHCIP